jgi:hypothetical protein
MGYACPKGQLGGGAEPNHIEGACFAKKNFTTISRKCIFC